MFIFGLNWVTLDNKVVLIWNISGHTDTNFSHYAIGIFSILKSEIRKMVCKYVIG